MAVGGVVTYSTLRNGRRRRRREPTTTPPLLNHMVSRKKKPRRRGERVYHTGWAKSHAPSDFACGGKLN